MGSNSIEFPASMVEKLGYYVYLLSDPETEKVFYVGKGVGNRIFAHVNSALINPIETEKIEKIKKIQSKGFEIKHEILRHGLTEKEAYEVEAALIDYIGLPELTNIVTGHETFYRGRMTVNELLALYEAKPIVIKEPSILIRVNKLYERNIYEDELYEITRGNWVLSERRNKAKYGFAIYNGTVRQVYRINSWFTVSARSKKQKKQQRWRFEGEIAEDMQCYVGGSVESYLKKGAQNPITYINC
jgi:hypothetical protein